MNGVRLSKKELQQIRDEIAEIHSRSELLDPSYPTDAEQLFFDDLRLEELLSTLELSYRKARIKELGLTVI